MRVNENNPTNTMEEEMRKEIIDRAIDTVFDIISEREKADKLNEMQKKLGFNSDFFSFGSLLDINEARLIDFLDWFFYGLSSEFQHPESEIGGLVSYTIYDAATPYIKGKPYYLKDKDEFKSYVFSVLNMEQK